MTQSVKYRVVQIIHLKGLHLQHGAKSLYNVFGYWKLWKKQSTPKFTSWSYPNVKQSLISKEASFLMPTRPQMTNFYSKFTFSYKKRNFLPFLIVGIYIYTAFIFFFLVSIFIRHSYIWRGREREMKTEKHGWYNF